MSSFAFVFPDGRTRRSDEMTREELLEVIDHMIGERNWWRDEAKGAAAFGNLLAIKGPRSLNIDE